MKKSTKRRRIGSVAADRAKLIAIEYCLFHYPTLYTAGIPRVSTDGKFWVVPIVLENPDEGISDRVGDLWIERRSGEVIRSTRPEKVVSAGERLYGEKRNGRVSSAVSSRKN